MHCTIADYDRSAHDVAYPSMWRYRSKRYRNVSTFIRFLNVP